LLAAFRIYMGLYFDGIVNSVMYCVRDRSENPPDFFREIVTDSPTLLFRKCGFGTEFSAKRSRPNK